MKEIKIYGLTDDQRDMLDLMWEIESIDDFLDWLSTLPEYELKMALTLKEVLLAHCIDEVNDTDIAKDYLMKFRL